jgi:glucose 1-dehydrogenase
MNQLQAQHLKGRVALVTGAARGIGRGVVEALASAGASAVINYLDDPHEAQQVADVVAGYGGEAMICQADVSDRAAVASMFAAAVERFGRIDIAVANAAYSKRELVLEAQWENVLRTLEVTQFGTFHTCQFAAQQMVKQGPNLHSSSQSNGGKIIVISSLHEEVAFPRSAAYNMAKAAVSHLARTMAAELTSYRINVNVINPGWIDTPGERSFHSAEALQNGGKRIPWGRMGTVEDIGQAALFLASDAADYITGTTLRVDGGFKMGLGLPSRS